MELAVAVGQELDEVPSKRQCDAKRGRQNDQKDQRDTHQRRRVMQPGSVSALRAVPCRRLRRLSLRDNQHEPRVMYSALRNDARIAPKKIR